MARQVAMSVPALSATRSWQRSWFLAGLAAFALCLVTTLLLVAALGEGAASWAAAIMLLGTLAMFAGMLAAARPRRGTLAIEGGALVTSWRKRPLSPRQVELGRWVLGGVDTTVGLVAHVRGDGEVLRIGGRDLDGEGHVLALPPTRSVECMLSAADFSQLMAALGLRPDERRARDLAVELVRNRFTLGAALAGMWPWLVTIAACAVYGLVLDRSGLEARLAREPYGRWLMGGIALAIVAAGIAVIVLRARRVKRPSLVLRADAGTLTLTLPDGTPRVTAPWSAVSATRQLYRWRMKGITTTMPALELVIGDHRPLQLAVWDPGEAWPGELPRGRTPRFLTGAPEWRKLVALLGQQQRLR